MPIVIGIVIVIAVLVAIFSSISAAKSAKGNVDLQLDKSTYVSGERIEGSVTLETKKPLEPRRFYATLTGTLVEERPDAEDLKDRKERTQVYAEETNLELQRLQVGIPQTITFEFMAPYGDRLPVEGRTREWNQDDDGNSQWERVKKKIEWTVSANLDLPGLDIGDAKRIKITLT